MGREWFVQRAMPGLVAIGSLLVIAAIGLQADRLPLQLILAASMGLIVAALALQNMALGLTLMVVAGGTTGFSIGTGTLSSINLAMIMVAMLTGLWLVRMAVTRRLRLAKSSLNVPLLGFLTSAILSWIASQIAVGPFVRLPATIVTVQAGQFGIYALAAAAFWLGANHRVEEKTLRIWAGFLAVLGCLVFAWDLGAGYRHSLGGHWTGSLYMWPVVFAVGQLLFNPSMGRATRLLGYGMLPMWALWAIRETLGFKGGWVPALLAIMLMLLLKSWRLLAVALLVLGVVLAGVIGPDRTTAALLQSEDDSASPLRWSLWVDVFSMGLRSPVIGLGLVSYSFYWNEPGFVATSYRYTSAAAFSRAEYSPPAHNMFADVFAQMGTVGLVLLLWVLVAGLRLAANARRRAPPGFLQGYATSILCGFASLTIASFVFADWLLPYVYNIAFVGFPQAAYSWLLLGTLVPFTSVARSLEADT